MLGENNLKLVWKGPYERHDSTTHAAPSNPAQDTLSVASYGCDAVVFLVFNKFSSDCKTQTYGHEFGGVSSGGMCEQNFGKGYTVVVDQVSVCICMACFPRSFVAFSYILHALTHNHHDQHAPWQLGS